LIGFENLEELDLDKNQLTELPNNLFRKMRKLRRISFWGNQLGTLSFELLKPIRGNDFIRVDFQWNKNIDLIYWPGERGSVNSIDEHMETIDSQCPKPKVLKYEENAFFKRM